MRHVRPGPTQQLEQRRGGAARQVAVSLHCGGGGLPHRLPPRWIAQQRIHPARQLRRVLHHGQAAGAAQHGDVVGEVAGMRPDRDGAAETGRFQRVLPATRRQQAAADEGDAGQPVPAAPVRPSVSATQTPSAGGPSPRGTVAPRAGDGGAAFRVTRGDDRQQARDGPPQARDGRRGPASPRRDGCWRRARPAGRPAVARSRCSSVSSAGSGGAASFRSPGSPTRQQPRARSRSASVALRGCTRAKPPSTCRASPGTRRQRPRLRSDSRALISIVGMRRTRHAASRFGHSSLSTNPAASGRQ